MRTARLAAGLGSIALLMTVMPSAEAKIFSGVCKLDITFEFVSSPTVGSVTGYTVTNNPSRSVCVLDTLETTATAVAGSSGAGMGGIPLSQCGVIAGEGPWGQSWTILPEGISGGSHVVAGTWVGATMVLSGIPGNTPARYGAVVVLTPHPAEPFANAKKMAKCAIGEPVSSIRMLGVQYFFDPPDEEDLSL